MPPRRAGLPFSGNYQRARTSEQMGCFVKVKVTGRSANFSLPTFFIQGKPKFALLTRTRQSNVDKTVVVIVSLPHYLTFFQEC